MSQIGDRSQEAHAARWQGTEGAAARVTVPVGPPPAMPWWEPRVLKIRKPWGALRGLAFVAWLFAGPRIVGIDRGDDPTDLQGWLWFAGIAALVLFEVMLQLRYAGHLAIDAGNRQVHWRRPRDYAPTRTWSFDDVTRVEVSGIDDRIRVHVGGRRFRLEPDPQAVGAVAALRAHARKPDYPPAAATS